MDLEKKFPKKFFCLFFYFTISIMSDDLQRRCCLFCFDLLPQSVRTGVTQFFAVIFLVLLAWSWLMHVYRLYTEAPGYEPENLTSWCSHRMLSYCRPSYVGVWIGVMMIGLSALCIYLINLPSEAELITNQQREHMAFQKQNKNYENVDPQCYKICRFFATPGKTCNKGANCKNAHEHICREWIKDECNKGEDCKYPHPKGKPNEDRYGKIQSKTYWILPFK